MALSPKDPGLHSNRIYALASVLLVHALLGWLLLTPSRPLPGHAGAGITVRWLPRLLPPPVPTPAALPALAPAPVPAPPPLARQPAQADAAPVQAPASIANPPLDLRLPPGSAAGQAMDAATFTAPILGQRATHPAFAAPSRRFRMKRGITPEQIVQGIAQALQMWPPGYIVDPCRLSTAQVDYMQNAVDEMDRDLLRRALISQRQDC